MKKQLTLAVTIALTLSALAGCTIASTESEVKETTVVQTTLATNGNFSDEMKMDYDYDLSLEDGADSVERMGDHEESIYFAHPDIYNLKNSEHLTILENYKTTQQTSEWACGVTAALTVLNYYDVLNGLTEEDLASYRHSLDGTDLEGYPGTTLNQEMDIFNAVGGFELETTYDYPNGIFLDEIQGWLKESKPVLICWNDWGGHWQVIIGYDTMGTPDYTGDDVIIVADPYDTTDHNQDGYGIYPAERFIYNFTMYNQFTDEEGGNDMLFVVPSLIK